MRRAIVHIGMPRTASTTLQHVLFHRRAALAAVGVLYPDLSPEGDTQVHLGHQPLCQALDGRRRGERDGLLRTLSRQLADTDADTVVLSDEDWSQDKRAGPIAAVLREVVERHGFRMEGVAVVKPQAEFLNSWYAHRMQLMAERRPFGAFSRKVMGSARFEYGRLVEPWRAACGGRFQLVPLRDRRDAAPPVRRFLRALGLAERVGALLDPAEDGRVENRSPGPVVVEASRRLRRLRVPERLTGRLTGRVTGRLAGSPRAAMREVEAMAAARGLDPAPFRGVDPALRARLEERHAAANERLARGFWGAGWAEVVREEAPVPPNEIGGRAADAATEAAVRALVADSCARWGLGGARPWWAGLAELGDDASDLVNRRLKVSRWRVV